MNANNYFKFSKFSITLIVSILFITLLATYIIHKQNYEKKKIVFENNANKLPYLIETRMKVYKQVLLAGVSIFYTSSHNVTRQSWKKFVEELKLGENYPGIQGIGFSLILKPEDKDLHINQMRNDGFIDYDINPKGHREIYTSIIYLEPFDERNKRAFGYDMYSQDTRKEAMKNAILTGKYSLSGKVKLLQENGIDEQAGFLVYIPVYKKELNTSDFQKRLESTLGFVYAPFRIKDLISSIDLENNKYLDIEIYDGKEARDDNLFYDSNSNHDTLDRDFEYKKVLLIGGKEWLIKITAQKDFFKHMQSGAHIVVLVFGTLLILFVLVLVYIYNFYGMKKESYYEELKSISIRKNLALEAATIGTWEWNFIDNSIKWDNIMYEIHEMDFNKSQNLKQYWFKYIDKKYKNTVIRNLIKSKKELVDFNICFWINTPNLKRKYIHSLGIVDYDKDKKPYRIIGINNDITEHEIYKQQLIVQKELIESEKTKFESIFNYSKDGIVITDLNTKFQIFNKSFLQMTNFSAEELSDKKLLNLVKQDDTFAKKVIEIKDKNFFENIELVCIVKNEENIAINLSMVLLPDRKNILFSIKDFTQIKKKERLIQEYINLIDKNVITSTTDLDGIITYASEAFCKISGYSKEELIGKNHNIIKDPQTIEETYEQMWNDLNANKTWKGELKNIKKDGSIYWVKTTISPIFNDSGKKVAYTAIREDITDKKVIEKLSITDALTNLHNRRYFNETFPKFIQNAKRKNELVCFALIDIDFFKQYNDTYGHQMGDEALAKVGKILLKCFNRSEDYTFRLGGEEFGVLFKANNLDKAYNFMNYVKGKIEDEKIIHEKNKASNFLTISTGLICSNSWNINDIEKIYKQADELLYKAKRTGRNKVLI